MNVTIFCTFREAYKGTDRTDLVVGTGEITDPNLSLILMNVEKLDKIIEKGLEIA